MKIRMKIASAALLLVLPLTGACGSTDSATSSSGSGVTSTSTATGSTGGTSTGTTGQPAGPGGGVDVDSVTTEAQLIELIQEAYGDGDLDLHRGHQPVQDVLNDVLAISHAELHTRMEAGQNLAAVATDIGVDPQTLIDALVASWSPAIDNVLSSGGITDAEADQYRQALQDAFSFRVNWNGTDGTPTFSGLSA